MIDEPFYSKQFINEILNNFEVRFVLLHTDFVSLERIFKTFFIYGPIKFISTVVNVLKNSINGGEINNILISNQIPTMKTKNINSDDVFNFIESKEIDVLISFNCPEKIKTRILNLPKIYPINIHLGYLPTYRGLFPMFHAFINKEDYAGVTIHIMNTKYDDGSILNQIKVPIQNDDTLLTLYEKAFSKIPKLTVETLIEVGNENNLLIENDVINSTYFSYPTLKQIFAYRKILWNR